MWPDLTLSEWADTRDTFHLWTQVVGKIPLALAPMVNHWWQITLRISARGLTTPLLHYRDIGLAIEFDLIDHQCIVRTTDGRVRAIALEPRSVASFYAAVMAALDELDIHVAVVPCPVELEEAIPFAEDEKHRAYDRDAVHNYWIALVYTHTVMYEFRSRFIGKVSPIHYFWGAGDLAVTRFSGRRAPRHPGGVPHCPDYVQVLAYSHEVSSCGFWLGGSDEGSFYSYAYPPPAGFADARVTPDGAYYDKTFGEFLLPYAIVRTADDPEAILRSFFESTYAVAADLGQWDRAALEVD